MTPLSDPPPQTSQPPRSILIVEDEAIIAMGLQADLEKLGFQVCGTAYRGAEAVQMVERLDPDLVLMDINLDGSMDGIDAAMLIRDQYDAPVIFLTAMADRHTLQRAKASQSFGYVLKPVRVEELAIAIEFGLHKHALEKEVRQSEAMARHQAFFAHRLSQASSRLNARLELSELYQTICAELAQSLEGRSFRLALYDPEKSSFELVHESGPAWPEDGVTSETFLKREGRLIGSLAIAWKNPAGALDEEALWFLTAFANQAAAAIEHARADEEAGRRAAELEIFYQLSNMLRPLQTRAAMLPILAEQALKIAQADTAAIFLIDQAGQPGASSQAARTGDPIPDDWFQPGEPLWNRVLSADSRWEQEELFASAGGPPHPASRWLCKKIAFPLRTAHGPAGILALGFPCDITLETGTRQVLAAFMEIAANALQRSAAVELLEGRVSDRTRELSTLYDLALVVNSPRDLEELLRASLERVLHAARAEAAALFLYEPHSESLSLTAQIGIPGEILAQVSQVPVVGAVKTWLETSQSPWLGFRDQSQMPGFLSGSMPFGSVLHIPVRLEGALLGSLTVLWQEVKDIAAEDIALLSAVAERLGSAIQNRSFRQQLEQAAVREERRRLARDLHDSVTQSLYSLNMLSEAGQDLASQGDMPRLDRCLRALQQAARQALHEMRLLLFELHEEDSQKLELIPALNQRLEAVEQRSGLAARLNVNGAVSLSTEYQVELYQIASEALNNVLKHALASQVQICITSTSESFTMEVADNGRGFDPDQVPQGGMGLGNIRERVRRLGGEFQLTSAPGAGTQIRVRLGQPAGRAADGC